MKKFEFSFLIWNACYKQILVSKKVLYLKGNILKIFCTRSPNQVKKNKKILNKI